MLCGAEWQGQINPSVGHRQNTLKIAYLLMNNNEQPCSTFTAAWLPCCGSPRLVAHPDVAQGTTHYNGGHTTTHSNLAQSGHAIVTGVGSGQAKFE